MFNALKLNINTFLLNSYVTDSGTDTQPYNKNTLRIILNQPSTSHYATHPHVLNIPEENEEDEEAIDPPKGVYNSLTEPTTNKKPTIFSFNNNNSGGSKKNMFTNLLSKRFGGSSNNNSSKSSQQNPQSDQKNSRSNGSRLELKTNEKSPRQASESNTDSSPKEAAFSDPPPPVKNSSTARANFFSSLSTDNQNKPNRNYVDVYHDDKEEEEADDVHSRSNSVELIPLKKQPQQQPETTEQCNKINSSRNSNSSNSSSDNNSKNKNSLTSQSILQGIKKPEDINSKQF